MSKRIYRLNLCSIFQTIFSIAILISTALPSLNSAFASADSNECGRGAFQDADGNTIDTVTAESSTGYEEAYEAARVETHSLGELLTKNLNSNLIAQHPSLAMDAAKLIKYLLEINGGSTLIRDPASFSGATTARWNLLALKNNLIAKPIIGLNEPIDRLISVIRRNADASQPSEQVPLLIGRPGVAKSVIAQTLNRAAMRAAIVDPRMFMYTIRWVGLEEIPALKDFLADLPSGSVRNRKPGEFETSMYQNPLALLPEGYRKAALANVHQHFLTSTGMTPLDASWFDDRLHVAHVRMRDIVFDHYGIKPQSDQEERFKVLYQHVRVVRHIYPRETSPHIPLPNEGDSFDSLMVGSLPMAVRLKLKGNKSLEPLFFEPGLIARCHGLIVFLDEIFRAGEMLNKYLDYLASGKLNSSLGFTLNVDSVRIGGTNPTSISTAAISAGDQTAAESRFHFIYVPVTTSPRLEAQVGLTFFGLQDLRMRRLIPIDKYHELVTNGGMTEEQNAEYAWQTGDLSKIFPSAPAKGASREAILASLDHSSTWQLAIQRGNRQMPIAPHALEFFASVVAAVRMETNPTSLGKAAAGFAVALQDPLFTDPAARIRGYLGMSNNVNTTQETLKSIDRAIFVSSLASTRGFGPRRVSSLLIEAERAALRENPNRPELTKSSFIDAFAAMGPDFYEEMGIDSDTFTLLVQQIAEEVILRRIERDFKHAVANDDASLGSTYELVYEDLTALAADPNAERIRSDVSARRIDRPRYEAVAAKFLSLYRTSLVPSDILGAVSGAFSGSGQRHPRLEEAVREYLLGTFIAGNPAFFDRLIAASSGSGSGLSDPNIMTAIDILRRCFGYEQAGLREAAQMVRDRVLIRAGSDKK